MAARNRDYTMVKSQQPYPVGRGGDDFRVGCTYPAQRGTPQPIVSRQLTGHNPPDSVFFLIFCVEKKFIRPQADLCGPKRSDGLTERLDRSQSKSRRSLRIFYSLLRGNTRKYPEIRGTRSILFRLLFRIFPHRRRRRSGYFQFGRTPRPPAFRCNDSTFQRGNARLNCQRTRPRGDKNRGPLQF